MLYSRMRYVFATSVLIAFASLAVAAADCDSGNTSDKARAACAEARRAAVAAARAIAQRMAFYREHAPVFEEAKAAEESRDGDTAARLYESLARIGHGHAALRLGQIYDRGDLIGRDYVKSLLWYDHARKLGVDVTNAMRIRQAGIEWEKRWREGEPERIEPAP